MGKTVTVGNLKKTLHYLKRNGIRQAWYAMRERIGTEGKADYTYEPVEESVLQTQLREAKSMDVKFSILVPALDTKETYLRAMIDSCLGQTYGNFELILADASKEDQVEKVVGTYKDPRIRYRRLRQNAGISANTEQALMYATGDYVGLLDHDDVLTPDALFEMAVCIEKYKKEQIQLQLLYSDEDKCDQLEQNYFEVNRKPDFNLDLILSNNYICHFMVMKRELVQSLGLRKEYEGAQDFDLVLRGACGLLNQGQEKAIAHIPMMLYHWRCHTGSTAENPQSKLYAYEAGRKAVQAFADRKKWKAEAADTEHLGFYRLEYKGNIFESRPELAALGGPVVKRRRIAGGRMSPEGKVFYEGLPLSYSGYLHRAVLQQQAEALDIRNIEVREELWELFAEITGVEYKVLPGTRLFDVSALPDGTDYALLSIKLGEAFRQKGYKLLYMPERRKKRTCRPGRYRQSMNRCKTGRTRGY